MPELASQLDALLHGCAVAIVHDRAFLRVTGSDATRWLNGMVTNSIQALQPGEGNYNFLLNAQGRIQGDAYIFREPAEGQATFLLQTDSTQLETILALLDKFIIMDDVELASVKQLSETMLLIGPAAPQVLRAIEVPAFSGEPTTLGTEPLRLGRYGSSAPQVTTPDWPTVPVIEVADARIKPETVAKAQEAGAIEVSNEALEAFRILTGTPRYSLDIRDRDLPQETNQPQALHFNKGCYLGQEIVERIRSRGQVHRLLTRFELTGDLPTELPAPLQANGKPAGEITSATRVPLEGEKLLALGYARREALELKQPLTYAGGSATPRR